MKISIIGTGYVGLVTGACLADRGHDVICVDIDPAKAAAINAGKAPIHEDGLPALLQRTIGRTLRATTDIAAAIADSEVTMIAVGTPSNDGQIDLQYVLRVARDIGAALARKASYHTVVVKSTVIPGTTDGPVRQALEQASGRRAGADFGLGMNPEFLTEGTALRDFQTPDRIVLGGIDKRAQEHLTEIYRAFPPVVPRIYCNNSTAEMIKYASNSVLATLISFSNEIGRLCSALGTVDVAEVMRGVHEAAYFTTRDSDGRSWRAPITSFLEAGCGFGGSCLPKDVTALAAQGRSHGLSMPLLNSVLEINKSQPEELLKLVRRHFPSLRGRKVTVLGLAFKPDTDDLRESPAFPVLRALRGAQADITVFDPVVTESQHAELQDLRFAQSLEAAIEQADVIIHVTRWEQFAKLGELLARRTPQPLVVDGRRNLAPASFARFEGIGR